MLAVIDLHKRYGSRVALEKVNFTVAAGELFGLLGPNGAGKTTLISILSGLSAATSGNATLSGRAVTPDAPNVRRLIGIAPQDLALYPDLTARENLSFFGRLYGLRGSELRARVEDVLAAVALADRADDRAGTFSGGMKRRLNLGLAVLHRPRVLFLDEPTAGVDPQSRNHIFEGVRRLNAEGVTVVYTSHYMEEVQALCTRIGILDHGHLIACDTLPALLRQLDARITFQVPRPPPGLRERVGALPDVRLTPADGPDFELSCPEVQPTLVRLLAVLNELNVTVSRLETHEPNLERVFLHLTGHGLRD